MRLQPRPARPPLPDHLGPWPEATVAMFADLGLAEDEIARHLRIDPAMVRDLHRRAARQDMALPPLPLTLPVPGRRRWRICRWLGALCDRLSRHGGGR
jgi:hypothetical protein